MEGSLLGKQVARRGRDLIDGDGVDLFRGCDYVPVRRRGYEMRVAGAEDA